MISFDYVQDCTQFDICLSRSHLLAEYSTLVSALPVHDDDELQSRRAWREGGEGCRPLGLVMLIEVGTRRVLRSAFYLTETFRQRLVDCWLDSDSGGVGLPDSIVVDQGPEGPSEVCL